MKISFGRLLFAFGAAALIAGVMGTLLFLIAGRWNLPWFWAYAGAYGIMCLSGFLLLDKGLIEERFRPGPNARDTALVGIAKVLAIVHYVIAGLDVGRFDWSGDIPSVVQATALVLFTLSGGVNVWAMAVNRFFSTVVRIQEERGHHVITHGPYRIVRHPGYVVMFIMLLASGVALGSWWSIIPAAVIAPLLIRRTALEDRFLHEHPEGYPDYARRVRYRLIPGIW